MCCTRGASTIGFIFDVTNCTYAIVYNYSGIKYKVTLPPLYIVTGCALYNGFIV